MLLHFLANFPIFLMKSRLFGWSESVWSILVSLCLAGCFFATLILLAAMHFGTGELRRIIFGKALCPSCRTAYNRPFFGFNAGMKRYERCPACGKWHWIDARDNVAAVSSAEQSESSL